jgi:hypothetical protein
MRTGFPNFGEMWLACYTQEEIADAVGCTKETVSEICQKQFRDTESDKPAINHLTLMILQLQFWRTKVAKLSLSTSPYLRPLFLDAANSMQEPT